MSEQQKFDEREVRIGKMHKIRELGVNPYPRADFKPDTKAADLVKQFADMSSDELEAKSSTYRLAGRVMMVRDFGKGGFVSITDETGKFQIYVSKKDLSEVEFNVYKLMDIGDIIGAEGKCLKTKTGDLAILAKKLVLLSKSLRSLPEKFHGLTDVEVRYRHRYLDLITSPESREVFRKRSYIVNHFRRFLTENNFLEVETPMMHPIPGGAAAKPFVTHHNTLDMKLFLRIAPELYLKRLIVGGFEKVFEINRSFRNEGISTFHNPEFTMMELYWAYATYENLMDLVEEIVTPIVKEFTGGDTIKYQGKDLSFRRPWKRMSVQDAVLKARPHFSYDDLLNYDKLYSYIKTKSYADMAKPGLCAAELMMLIFDEEVQPHITDPVFITHYPVEISPLARRFDEQKTLTERFELFIAGKEVANAFTELNDPIDQRGRFEDQMIKRVKGDEEAHELDEDFIAALEHAMPPTGGLGIGIDRLTMLLTDSASIRDVILFPLLKSRAE